MCGGHGSFRLRFLATAGHLFNDFLSCLAHPREVIRAGRQKPDVCRCAAFIKKEHISSSTVSSKITSCGISWRNRL